MSKERSAEELAAQRPAVGDDPKPSEYTPETGTPGFATRTTQGTAIPGNDPAYVARGVHEEERHAGEPDRW